MSGTIGGFIYATPDDHPLNWPATSQTLATTLSNSRDTAAANRALGTLGNMGTFDPAKPIRHQIGWSIQTTNAQGFVTVVTPTPLTCIVGVSADVLSQGTGEAMDMRWVIWLNSSSLTGLVFQARSVTTPITALASQRTGMIFDIAYQ